MSGTYDRMACARELQPANTDSTPPSSVHPADMADQLRRLAALVTDGQIPVPDGLPEADLESLLANVGLLRRARLMDYFALAIALDIHRTRSPESLEN